MSLLFPLCSTPQMWGSCTASTATESVCPIPGVIISFFFQQFPTGTPPFIQKVRYKRNKGIFIKLYRDQLCLPLWQTRATVEEPDEECTQPSNRYLYTLRPFSPTRKSRCLTWIMLGSHLESLPTRTAWSCH